MEPVRHTRSVAHHENRAVALSQLTFGAVLLAIFGTMLLFESTWANPLLFFGAVVITFLSSGAAVLVPWQRISPRWVMVLPLLDILVIAGLRLDQPELEFGLLWVFPVIWMSNSFGRCGAVVSVAAVWACVWFDLQLRGLPLSATSVPTFLLLPLVIAFVAASSHFSFRRSTAQRALLRKQAELLEGALAHSRSSAELLVEVLNTVDFGVIRIDPAGQITLINQAQSEMPLGLDASAGPSRTAPPLTDERANRLAPDDSPLQRALRGEEFDAVTVWAGEAGTKRSAFQVTARHLNTNDGHYEGSVVVSRNITAELSAVRARDDLIASASHELRTPLTSILGYLELALDSGELSATTKSQLTIAYRNSNRLLELVADILSASRDGTHPLTLNLAPCDLVGIVEQSVESLEPRARELGIRVDVQSHGTVTVNADSSRLRQVVDNILSNAIKYNVDDGAISIRLSEDETTVALSVRDTGIGIPLEEQPRLFEHFFRSEAVRNSSVHGSGLGLGISRDLMRRHGGDLIVHSAVGDGTTVLLTIPRLPTTSGRLHPLLVELEENHAI